MIQIVQMDEQHVGAVATLEKECFSAPWSLASVTSELTNPLSVWLVALEDGAVAGYVGSQSVLDEADMMNVAVAPEKRRKGVAEALLTELIKQLKENGVRCLTLEVRVSNAGAIALYEKLGFQAVGKRPRYYSNPREDALILRKEWDI